MKVFFCGTEAKPSPPKGSFSRGWRCGRKAARVATFSDHGSPFSAANTFLGNPQVGFPVYASVSQDAAMWIGWDFCSQFGFC
jgi:hypothetical protein